MLCEGNLLSEKTELGVRKGRERGCQTGVNREERRKNPAKKHRWGNRGAKLSTEKENRKWGVRITSP